MGNLMNLNYSGSFKKGKIIFLLIIIVKDYLPMNLFSFIFILITDFLYRIMFDHTNSELARLLKRIDDKEIKED